MIILMIAAIAKVDAFANHRMKVSTLRSLSHHPTFQFNCAAPPVGLTLTAGDATDPLGITMLKIGARIHDCVVGSHHS